MTRLGRRPVPRVGVLALLGAALLSFSLLRGAGLAQPSGAERSAARYPVVPGTGGAYRIDGARPSEGRRHVVFDVSRGGSDGAPPPGLVRAARLLNVYAVHGVPPEQVRLTAVIHGDATPAVLTDAAHRRHEGGPNPHADLLRRLDEAGVRIEVCGQALRHGGYRKEEVVDEARVVAAAITALVDAQRAGAALLVY
jgi:intracellular sulfur oxidation DsrE/DsrF family protein